jgi:hypothetical protein
VTTPADASVQPVASTVPAVPPAPAVTIEPVIADLELTQPLSVEQVSLLFASTYSR